MWLGDHGTNLVQSGKRMKRITIILVFVLIYSCEKDFEAIQEVAKIEACDFEKFENIHIKARVVKDGKNIAYYYDEKINGVVYRVPNSKYYPYSSLDEKLKDNIESHEGLLTIDKKGEKILSNKSQDIFELFSCINFYQIYGDAEYCKCIRFDYSESIHLYYIKELSQVKSEIINAKLDKARKVKENWYLVID